MKHKFIFICLLLFPIVIPANQKAQQKYILARHALVIGNDEYQYIPKLDNPANDARDIGKVLSELGFNVDLQINISHEQMETAINRFGRLLAKGGIGLFYYAGHGVQVNGSNFIIPINAKLERQKDLRYKSVNIGQILDEMDEARNGLNIVILDACRDNPLKEFRSTRSGLAEVNAPIGTLVAYATSPGSVAADGNENNGLYTKYLLKYLTIPGLSLEQVFKKVRQEVNEETNGKQVPWVSSSFTGEFFFIPTESIAPPNQSKKPLINNDALSKSEVLWLVIAIIFLLVISLSVCVLFYLKRKPKKITQPKLTSPKNQNLSTPDISLYRDPQASGYLIELKNNQALANIKPDRNLILGRSRSRTDICLTNTAISATHAEIKFHTASNGFSLEDLNSSNNTWIAGQTPLINGVKTTIQPDEIFYLAKPENAFYIFVPDK